MKGAAEPSPLSSGQQRLWFLECLSPGRSTYTVPLAWRLSGRLNETALGAAVDALIDAHDALRMTFPVLAGQPRTLVIPRTAPSLRVESFGPAEAAETAAFAEVQHEGDRSFDLGTGPLYRARLLKLGDEDALLCLSFHHSVIDGWSLELLIRDLGIGYTAATAGMPLRLPEAGVSYGQYVQRERAWSDSEEHSQSRAYWQAKLRDAPAALRLTDANPISDPAPIGDSIRFEVPSPIVDGLRTVAKDNRTTLFVVVLAAYQSVLAENTNSTDVIVGTSSAGRATSDLYNTVGFFVNTLALRTDCGGRPTTSEMVQRARDTVLEAWHHDRLPFDEAVRATGSRHPSSMPIVQVWLELRRPLPKPHLPGLSVEPLTRRVGATRAELSLHLEEAATGALRGLLTYSAALYTQKRIEQFVESLQTGLCRFATASDGCTAFHVPRRVARQEGSEVGRAVRLTHIALPNIYLEQGPEIGPAGFDTAADRSPRETLVHVSALLAVLLARLADVDKIELIKNGRPIFLGLKEESTIADVATMIRASGRDRPTRIGAWVESRGGGADGILEVALKKEAQGSGTGLVFAFNGRQLGLCATQKWLRHLDALEKSSDDAPTERIWTLPILSDAERNMVIESFNRKQCSFDLDAGIHDIYSQQAARTPDAVAAVMGDVELTFGEIEAQANRLARALVRRGVRPGSVVGICLERSPDLLSSLLAVLKTGSAFLPLDPSYPSQRLEFMITDSGCRIVVASEATAAGVEGSTIVNLDNPGLKRESSLPLGTATSPASTAYLIYTSGSTGEPKGVLVPHRPIVSLTAALAEELQLPRAARVLQFAPFSFDAFIKELAISVLIGGTLCFASTEEVLPGAPLIHTLRNQRINVLSLPPSALAVMKPPSLPELEMIISAGEPCSANLIDSWSRQYRFADAYGPTEGPVVIAAVEHQTSDQRGTVGTPLPNVRIYVLDRHRQPVPVGVTGELYCGGVGPALGYLNRPELTAERFVADEYSGCTNARMYATGDRARWRSDGMIELLGRIDRQVKIRGFRIECGEIEAVLQRHPAVRQAVVDVRHREHSNQLVAYIIGEAEPAELRRFLSASLPSFMVPAHFVRVEAFPTTARGKVKTSALANAEQGKRLPAEPRALKGELERTLGEIYGDVLGVSGITRTDDFFELGGDSLSAARIAIRASERLNAEIPVALIFTAPTIKRLAAAIGARLKPLNGGEDAATVRDMLRDTELALPHIVGRSAGDAALVTGGTGLLGPYLMKELLHRGHKVYCIVRARDRQHARERVREAFSRTPFSECQDDRSIIPLPGDLARPRLGLDPDQFEAIAAETGMVLHAGAEVDMFAPYDTLRQANVLGTKELLNLAALSGATFRHISSTAALSPATGGSLDRGTLAANPDWAPRLGYGRSKWVAEQLVMQTRVAGLHAAVFRPTRIGGDSHTGAWVATDFLARLLITAVRVGSAPNLTTIVDVLPVDLVAWAIVYADPAAAGAITISHPKPLPFASFLDAVEECGVTLRRLAPARWIEAVRSELPEDDSIAGPLLPLVAYAATTRSERGVNTGRSLLREIDVPSIRSQIPLWLDRFAADGYLAVGTRT